MIGPILFRFLQTLWLSAFYPEMQKSRHTLKFENTTAYEDMCGFIFGQCLEMP